MDGSEPLGLALNHHSGRDPPGKSARCGPITASTEPPGRKAKRITLETADSLRRTRMEIDEMMRSLEHLAANCQTAPSSTT